MDAASAVITWKSQLLLFHRDDIPTIPYPNCWSLPGGLIEAGETPLQGLKRELQEEVSYVPQDITPIHSYQEDHRTFYLYYSRVSDHEAQLFRHGPGEGQEIAFFPLPAALKLDLTPKVRELLTNLPLPIIA